MQPATAAGARRPAPRLLDPRLIHASSRRSRPSPASRGRRRLAARPGMTLIEILVVIVVLAILAALVAPTVFQHVAAAKDSAARSQLDLLGSALDAYRLDSGSYPTTEQGLQSLRVQPQTDPVPAHWRGPYLRKEVPLDPWERPYVFVSPGTVNPWGYDLLTYGKDGKPGGTGEDRDITAWE